MIEYNITLIGNPNVGKSTIFNALTGQKQHTGNWSGKTVGSASGTYYYKENKYNIYDLPGTYSLIARSKEEEISRDFIYNNKDNITVIVLDSTMLEKGLNLVLQTMEVTSNVIVCLNLMDEAIKKEIEIDINRLSKILKVPVIGMSAKEGVGLEELKEAIYNLEDNKNSNRFIVTYDKEIEQIINSVSIKIDNKDRAYIINLLVNSKIIDNQDSVLFKIKTSFYKVEGKCKKILRKRKII